MGHHNENIAIVDEFLQRFEARDLGAASTMMTEEPTIVFPPGRSFRSLSELAQGLSKNYNWVKKHRTHYSVGEEEVSGRAVVVSRGTLYGEDLSGQPFEDIAYIDYFVIEGGLIAEQHVWNHLAAAGIMRP